EAEHVADDRARQVGDRPLLEQVDVIRDLRHVLALAAGYCLYVVSLGLVVLMRSQPVGPDDRPGSGRGFTSDRGRRLDSIDSWLRCYAERTQNVAVLGLVIGVVVAHLGVGRDA